MRILLLLLLLAPPLVEIAVLISVGGAIGVLPTIALVVGTAVIGLAIVRAQGLSAARRAREKLARGERPLEEGFDGALLALAGLFLIIPGFVSDAMGFALTLAPARKFLYHRLAPNANRADRNAAIAAEYEVVEEPTGPEPPGAEEREIDRGEDGTREPARGGWGPKDR